MTNLNFMKRNNYMLNKKKLKKSVDLDSFVPGFIPVALDLDADTMKMVEDKMATGLYLSKGEVIRDALRHSLEASGLLMNKKSSKKK